MNPLIRNAELPRQVSLGCPSRIPSTDDDVTFSWSESRLTRRGNGVEPFEHTCGGSSDPSQARSDLRPISPYGAKGAHHSSNRIACHLIAPFRHVQMGQVSLNSSPQSVSPALAPNKAGKNRAD